MPFSVFQIIQRDAESIPTGANVYFAVSYCAWKKDTNENLKVYFVNSTSKAEIFSESVFYMKKPTLINTRPQKIFGLKKGCFV